MMNRFLLAGFILFLFSGLGSAQPKYSTKEFKHWVCSIQVQEKAIQFKLYRKASDGSLSILNGLEKIDLERSFNRNDSSFYTISIFDAGIKLPNILSDYFEGSYFKLDTKTPGYSLPISGRLVATQSNPVEREPKVKGTSSNIESWRLDFLDEKGILQDSGWLRFYQENGMRYGTILTETGDFRYLNGYQKDSNLVLQTFDGGHTYYFDFFINSNKQSLRGDFFYGKTGKQFIKGRKEDRNFLSKGFRGTSASNDIFSFEAIDSNGLQINLNDPSFNGKAFVVQIMGTWCPNCLDETKFLSSEYNQRPKGVEFLGLAFEKKTDLVYAFSRIRVVKNKLKVPYKILFCGAANKDSASKMLPILAPIQAFPTTVFVRKDHTILKVHSGFSGPATGTFYDAWKKQFRELMLELVAEN